MIHTRLIPYLVGTADIFTIIENRIINFVPNRIKNQNNVMSILFKDVIIYFINWYLTSNINKIIRKHDIYYLDLLKMKSYKFKKILHIEEWKISIIKEIVHVEGLQIVWIY